MKSDIILAGVGGQGILSIAAGIGMAAVRNNLFFKQSEVHGMSQRGGAVQSHFRLSDKPVASDLIPNGKADLIISVEPMEALRYTDMLSEGGWVVTSINPFKNIPDYPDFNLIMDELNKLPHVIKIDADQIAKDLGSNKASNMVMLGAASPFISMSFESIEQGIRDLFGRKGEDVVALNLKALQAGRDFTQNYK